MRSGSRKKKAEKVTEVGEEEGNDVSVCVCGKRAGFFLALMDAQLETRLSAMCYFLYLAGKGKRGNNTQLAKPDLRGWFIGSC
jgi:hypothetical protein